MLMMGWGMQRALYGEEASWAGFALAAVLGQMNLAGGGIGTNYHYCSGGASVGFGPRLRGITGRVAPARAVKDTGTPLPVIPIARFADAFLNPGETIDFNGRKVTYPDIRLVLWSGGNPFAHQPQTLHLERAWQKPETVIVTDFVWTATARHADIVFPAATVFERNDITDIGVYNNAGLCTMQQAVHPVGEARSDYRTFQSSPKGWAWATPSRWGAAKRTGSAQFTKKPERAPWDGQRGFRTLKPSGKRALSVMRRTKRPRKRTVLPRFCQSGRVSPGYPVGPH